MVFNLSVKTAVFCCDRQLATMMLSNNDYLCHCSEATVLASWTRLDLHTDCCVCSRFSNMLRLVPPQLFAKLFYITVIWTTVKARTKRRDWTELNWHGLVFGKLTNSQAVMHYSSRQRLNGDGVYVLRRLAQVRVQKTKKFSSVTSLCRLRTISYITVVYFEMTWLTGLPSGGFKGGQGDGRSPYSPDAS